MVSLFDTGPAAPCPAPFNMADYVLSQSVRLADKPALIELGGATLSYRDLKDRVTRVAAGLSAAAPAGGRVLFRIGNSADFPIAYLACIWAGLVPMPVSAQLTVPEITQVARQTNPALILADDGVSRPADCDAPVLHALPQADPIPPVRGDPNRLAYIVFTSGTSGTPRGVMHAHRAIWARRMMHEGWYGLSEADRLMHAGAFNWTYTLGTGLMDPWSLGATAIIPAPGTPASELSAIAAELDVTLLAAAPGVFRQMLKTPLAPMPALRHGLSAGEHLSNTIRADWQARTGTDLHQALGMSECSTFVSSSPSAPAPQNASGRPQNGRKVAILQDGAPVPFDTAGTLAVATTDPGLMIGYLDAEAPKGAWFETGDTAQMAPDGTVTYLGRNDDMMNAGGFRVSPLEVEAAFATLPDLAACAAVEVRIKADASVIVLFHATDTDEQTLRAHAEQTLARYKQPRLYIPVAALPYGANGKLNRRALRAQYEASHDRDHPA